MKNALLSLSLLVLVTCGPKPASKRRHSEMVQVFIKGDPMVLLADTVQDKKSFLNIENIDGFGDYALAKMFLFNNKDYLIRTTDPENIEDGNEATAEDLTNTPKFIFNFRKVTESEVLFENEELKTSFKFVLTDNGDFELTSFTYLNQKIEVSPQHYSISEDKSKFSFLAYAEDSKGEKILISTSFYLKQEVKKETRKVDPKYAYIYGPGVLVPWKLDEKREIKVNICSKIRDLDTSKVETSLRYWEGYSYPKLINIKVDFKTNCRPFSDVNESNIFYIKDYLTTYSKDAYNPGVTLNTADLYENTIFDSDIFLYSSEINKDPYFSSYDMQRVLMHEFGHFLGLHHMFDGTKSIMSYDLVYFPTEYDRAAVKHLYFQNEPDDLDQQI